MSRLAATSELRGWLEDEMEALGEVMPTLEGRIAAFWSCPEPPELAVWANFPAIGEVPAPPPGPPSEQHLYYQLMTNIKPTLESREHGFDTVPMLLPCLRYYAGPPFGTHFLAAVLGAEVSFPDKAAGQEQAGWDAWSKPLIADLSELPRVEEIDVARSPIMQALLRGYEEMAEIVRGRIPFRRFVMTYPLDFAADVIGHLKFFELLALEPEAAARLIEVCTRKWMEIIELQARAVGGRMVSRHYEPGLLLSDMILPFLSPRIIRKVVLAYNASMSALWNGIFVDVKHPDASLLDDYLSLPGLRGCSVPSDWSWQAVIDGLQGRGILLAGFDWHFHEGEEPSAPICRPWGVCCRHLAQVAGKLRVLATVSAWGKTPAQQRECALRDLADLRQVWDDGGSRQCG